MVKNKAGSLIFSLSVKSELLSPWRNSGSKFAKFKEKIIFTWLEQLQIKLRAGFKSELAMSILLRLKSYILAQVILNGFYVRSR